MVIDCSDKEDVHGFITSIIVEKGKIYFFPNRPSTMRLQDVYITFYQGIHYVMIMHPENNDYGIYKISEIYAEEWSFKKVETTNSKKAFARILMETIL